MINDWISAPAHGDARQRTLSFDHLCAVVRHLQLAPKPNLNTA
jgi:hypothetical protein